VCRPGKWRRAGAGDVRRKRVAAERRLALWRITVVMFQPMAIAHSKLTAQGQISVPAKVRRKLGIGPGSVLEWHEEGEKVVVRRAGRYTSEDVHRALFPKRPPRTRTVEEMKAGVRRYMKKRHARG
jgi:AbrB family looped-hinge helix DNA binding protein